MASETPASDYLVVPQTPEAAAAAFVYARKLRESGDLVRVEIDLESRETLEGVREYARDRRIAQIAWVNAEGFPTIETERTLWHTLLLLIPVKALPIASALVRWLAFTPVQAKMSRVRIGFG